MSIAGIVIVIVILQITVVGNNMRYSFKRSSDLYPSIGVELTTSSGCLGTTYGDDRGIYFRSFRFKFLKWGWELCFSWRK